MLLLQLHRGEKRLRERKWFSWGHTAREWWRWYSNSGSVTQDPFSCYSRLCILAVSEPSTSSLLVPQGVLSPIVAGTEMSLLFISASIYKNSYLLWLSTAPFIFTFLSLALLHVFLIWTICVLSCQEQASSFLINVAGGFTQQLCSFLCVVEKRCWSN